jgi:hypothetical protein
MADQTAIDVYERGKYSEDHREHRDGEGDAPKGSPIDHDATLTESGADGSVPASRCEPDKARRLGWRR